MGVVAVWVTWSRRARGVLAPLAFAAWAAGMFAFMWYVSEPGERFADFRHAYYFAGRQIRDDPSALYSTLEPTAAFTNIPIVAWLFVPLAALPEGPASWVMFAIGIAAVLAACALVIHTTRATRPQAVAIAGLFAMNGPIYNSLREGNTTHIVLLLLALALWCAERRRDVAVGALIATAAIIKPPLALLLVPFVLRGRWAAPAAFVATVSPVVLLSLAIYGIGLHRDWYETTVSPFSRHPVGAFNVQSIDALLARLISGGTHLFDWDPIAGYGAGFGVVRTAIVVAIAAGSVLWCWRSRLTDVASPALGADAAEPSGLVAMRTEFCVALAVALVITPISWSHYYLTLIIPMSLLLTGRIPMPRGRGWWVAFGASVVLLSLPVVTLNPERAVIGEFNSRVMTSHFVIGGIVMLALLLAVRRRVAGDVAAGDRAPTGVAHAG
jgi:hypothetical protein